MVKIIFLIFIFVSSAFGECIKKTDMVFCGKKYSVEIVSKGMEKTIGLMFRKELAPNSGMLFVYPEQQVMSFWMKNTMIPLGIIFFDSAGKIVGMKKMEPGVGLPDQRLPSYSSGKPAQFALEINASELSGFSSTCTLSVDSMLKRCVKTAEP